MVTNTLIKFLYAYVLVIVVSLIVDITRNFDKLIICYNKFLIIVRTCNSDNIIKAHIFENN